MNLPYFGILTLLTYLSVALAQGLHLVGYLPWSRWHYLTGAFLSLCGHGWVLYQLIETPLGQNLSGPVMFSLVLWMMNLLVLLCTTRTNGENICVLTYPIAALSIGIALLGSGDQIVDTRAHPGVLPHIFISLFAVSLLALAGLQALLMGMHNYLLKNHAPTLLLHTLPPLQSMEALLFRIITVGVLCLSGSLLSGFFFLGSPSLSWLWSKMLLAFSAWILLSMLLLGRIFFGWRAGTAIRWTLSGTLLTVLSYFGTKALLL